MSERLFTSESVTEGHPDKVADQISDAVLDAVYKDDPKGRVACETYVTTGLCLVGGEITTETYADIPGIARQTIKEIGYTNADFGYDIKPAPSSPPSISSRRISPWVWIGKALGIRE